MVKVKPGGPLDPPPRKVPLVDVDEVRLGGRNFIRRGYLVRVLPSKPGKRDGFEGKVTRITSAGGAVEVEVFGGPGRKPPASRTFLLDRLAYREQTVTAADGTRVPRNRT